MILTFALAQHQLVTSNRPLHDRGAMTHWQTSSSEIGRGALQTLNLMRYEAMAKLSREDHKIAKRLQDAIDCAERSSRRRPVARPANAPIPDTDDVYAACRILRSLFDSLLPPRS